MLNTIYDILGIIIGILATIVLVDETVIKIKNKNKSIISSMIRGDYPQIYLLCLSLE